MRTDSDEILEAVKWLTRIDGTIRTTILGIHLASGWVPGCKISSKGIHCRQAIRLCQSVTRRQSLEAFSTHMLAMKIVTFVVMPR